VVLTQGIYQEDLCFSNCTQIKYEGKLKYLKQVQGSRETYLCLECDFQAKVEAVLVSHVRLHGVQYGEDGCTHSCNLCHYNTGSKPQLEFHMRTCHKHKLEDTRQDCYKEPESDTDYSDVEFISDHEASLDDHLSVSPTMMKPEDNVDPKFPKFSGKYGRCLDSGASTNSTPTTSIQGSNQDTTSEHSLEKYFQDQHRILEIREKSFQCLYCPRSFQKHLVLSKHEKDHKMEMGVTKHQCNFCPYQSSIRHNMIRHMKRHCVHNS